MATQAKLGDRGGVSQWRKLETAGDVRRFIAWTIHSVRNGTLDRATAAVFSQLALAALKACAESSFEERLRALEEAVAHNASDQPSSPPTTH